MHGLHLTAELHHCVAPAPGESDLMRDADALRDRCLASVRDCGLRAVGTLFHPFEPPGGVTGVVLLAESHLAVHTWPEQSAVTLDVYVCNFSTDNTQAAERLMQSIRDAFGPTRITQQRWVRGALPALAPQRTDRPNSRATSTPAAWPNANASSNTE